MDAKLTASQVAKLARALRTRYEALAAEAQTGAERAREAARQTIEASTGDSADRAGAVAQSTIESAEFSRDVREMRDIEAALKRLEEGSYVECTDCGGEIGLARLTVNPTARRCVGCQSVHEKIYAVPGTASPWLAAAALRNAR